MFDGVIELSLTRIVRRKKKAPDLEKTKSGALEINS